MSDLLAAPSGDEEEGSRRRAVWGLVALAGVAGLIVLIMLIVIGNSGGGSDDQGLGGAGPTIPATPSVHTLSSATPTSSSSGTPMSPSAPASTSAHPTATRTGPPCPSASPCAVPGDGRLLSAVNTFRTSHGRAAVPGAVTAQAQQCALSQGNGPTCVPHYAWEPAPTQDGAKVISLTSADWLLDPAMTSFSVGWAYTPGPGGGPGQYECAILKVG